MSSTSVSKPKEETPPAAEEKKAAGAPSAAPAAAPAAEAAPSADVADGTEGGAEGKDGYDLSGWKGNTPKTMLFEWFQKRQQPRPKMDIVSEGRRFRATVSVSGGLVYELPENESFDK